jgi:hypothetical protein
MRIAHTHTHTHTHTHRHVAHCQLVDHEGGTRLHGYVQHDARTTRRSAHQIRGMRCVAISHSGSSACEACLCTHVRTCSNHCCCAHHAPRHKSSIARCQSLCARDHTRMTDSNVAHRWHISRLDPIPLSAQSFELSIKRTQCVHSLVLANH